ncbi:AAA family ATPase [Brachybacterium sp. SGAir0954]|uniref:ATP-binding protein n=1 Tax=Brachybacterium sp. SGAir0954 TaxID=2571029 RepID=UPI0010CD2F66|nr:GNAT family N-acetyltransferase [Brachybacterium sp. SGAir0954]QCR52385.1 AAA family ATPase [Brachybacterium sp. SGAir0954]
MAAPIIREIRSDDLGRLVALWDATRAADVSEREPVYGLSEVLASAQADVAVVALADEDGPLLGAAVGRAAHEQGWIVYLGVHPDHRDGDLGRTLLDALERRLALSGIATLCSLVPADDPLARDVLAGAGFTLEQELRYAERRIPVQARDLALLRELGGRILPRGAWDAVGGMTAEKELLERRLVMPLSQPEVAERFGVVPPRAVVLFGPPGTGKTTFAKAVASRLQWPFVEVFPSRLGGDPAGLASALRETFSRISELEKAVVFIDEVEEIASHRKGDPPSPTQGVTNELLKIIPAVRDQDDRLLICATNFIRSLDSALLRHGRFDYVLPIGLPDAAARHAIWGRYVPPAVAAEVDLEALVAASEGLTPADIEHGARRAAQRAFERAVEAPSDGEQGSGPSTADYLEALSGLRPTVSAEVVSDFFEDIEALGRL